MIYFEFGDKEGEVIHSTIHNLEDRLIFENKEKENCSLGNFKQVYKTYPFGTVRLIGPINHEALITSRIASRTIDVYSDFLNTLLELKKRQETQYSIFSHNLITTHSRLQDEIESIIPEERLAKALTYSDQVAEIRRSIESDIDGASESTFEIAKRIIDLQSQITGFKILSGEIKPDIWAQNIKKVLLNIIYPYYEDFKRNEIIVNIYIDSVQAANNLVPLDYKVFNIAMHHFLNNAVKYVYPHSHIDIKFDAQNKELSFDMISVKIEEHELDTIFDLKVSGANAVGLSGEGIGMFMINKALKLLNAEMKITPDYSIERRTEKTLYTKNIFCIQFKS